MLSLLPLLFTITIADKWSNPCQSTTGDTAVFMLDAARNDHLLCISAECFNENTGYTNRVTQGFASQFIGYSMKTPLTLYYSSTYSDNMVTTGNPPDNTYYDAVIQNGYIFSQPGQGRIPLNMYYNKDKKDHATLANKTAEAQLVAAGYVLQGTQGYIYGPDAVTNGTNTNQSPYCDMSSDFQSRAKNLVYDIEYYNSIFLETYQGLSGNTAAGITATDGPIQFTIPPYQWWSEALHGVAGSPGVTYSGPIKHSTMVCSFCIFCLFILIEIIFVLSEKCEFVRFVICALICNFG